jgi:MFS transporter, DHA1 family, multidrug resistance protein
MRRHKQAPFFILLLMISFAAVNAVLFTPGLPALAHFFKISNDSAQLTITLFLIAYALGQLVYGPLANRFGRKPALYIGISLQIAASLLCVSSAYLPSYTLLLIGRFLLALGAGVGLKMTFTIVNECNEPQAASQKIAYLMLAFAITPGLAIALGGFLTLHYGWISCFYAGACYGLILLLLVTRLPETLLVKDNDAFKLSHLLPEYHQQFKNKLLVSGGLLMGGSSAFVYVFAALAPFIAINAFHLSSDEYGLLNLIPTIGLFAGSMSSAKLALRCSLSTLIFWGIVINTGGALLMLIATLLSLPIVISLFLPMLIILFGLSFVLPNASALAMSQASDKAHASAVMSFVNMGLATLAVLSIGYLPFSTLLLPLLFVCFSLLMFMFYQLIMLPKEKLCL